MSVKAVDDAFERLKAECKRRGYNPYIMLRLAIRLGEMHGKTIPRKCERGRKCPKSQKKKKVRCVETGKVYKTAAEASRETGISASAIRNVLVWANRTAGGYRWEYIRDNQEK